MVSVGDRGVYITAKMNEEIQWRSETDIVCVCIQLQAQM